jgi:hypothetical protein
MMRCQSCKQITAVFGLVCTCGGLLAAACADESGASHRVILFTRPDFAELAHNHEERGAPPMNARIIVAAASTHSGVPVWPFIKVHS